MAKLSLAEATARDVIDDDTAAEGRLVGRLAAIERLVWLAAADGAFSPQEMREIAGALRGSRVEAAESLDRNRLAAGLLCLHVAGIDPHSRRAAERLPGLPALLERFVAAEDEAVEPEDLVA